MKGRFSVKRDPYTGHVLFGNLNGGRYTDEESFFIGFENKIEGRVLAHDVVEHSIAHRTNKTVTVEEELRALGAVMFVRPESDIKYDIVGNLQYAAGRKLRPVPPMIKKYIDENIGIPFEYEDIKGSYESEYENKLKHSKFLAAMYQVRWGQIQKEWQFDGDQWAARQAFEFIKANTDQLNKALMYQEMATGLSVYFDTELRIFNWRFKWR